MMVEGLYGAGILLLRNVAGWLENSMQDGQIQKYEWVMLAETVMKTGLMAGMLYLGLNGAGVDVSMMASSASAVAIDMVLSKLGSKN